MSLFAILSSTKASVTDFWLQICRCIMRRPFNIFVVSVQKRQKICFLALSCCCRCSHSVVSLCSPGSVKFDKRSYSLLIQYELYGNTNAHFGYWNVIILHAFTDVIINTLIYWFHMNTNKTDASTSVSWAPSYYLVLA